MSEPALLALENLECVRDGRELFRSLSLRLHGRELVSLEGANGAGKSTLLRCVAGLYPDYAGELEVAPFVYAGHKTGLCGHLTTAENLEFLQCLDACDDTDAQALAPLCDNLGQALVEVGLAGYDDVRCNALSAGQARRVGLARLLLSQAPLWLLDEPLTALDSAGADLLGALLQRHLQAGGSAVCATHQALPAAATTTLHLARA